MLKCSYDIFFYFEIINFFIKIRVNYIGDVSTFFIFYILVSQFYFYSIKCLNFFIFFIFVQLSI